MKKTFEWLFNTPVDGMKEILLIRLMTGSVFFWEGILKFVYTNQGVGRFTKLGLPMPETMAHFVAVCEIIGGLFILLGFYTRPVSFYFILQMIVAILATKVSLYMGTSPLPLPPSPPTVGIWAVLHETRADWAQLLTSVFLLLVGPGTLSWDHQRKQ